MKASFTRDAEDLLAGIGTGSARRGKTVLRLIYAHVADCVKTRAESPTNLYQGEALQDTRNLAYLGAVVSGVQNPNPPGCTIQNLEKYAHEWADIVPRSPAIRAELARRIADSFSFKAHDIPGISAALYLDDTETAEEYHAQTGTVLTSIYAETTPVSEKIRWVLTRVSCWIENLPAFWASFALTITSTLGPSVLALPIVFMHFGPVAAAMMILGIGGINTLTLAYLAESQLRGRPILRRLGFNHIIGHYFGSAALNYLKVCLFLYCIVVLFAFTGGFLEAITSTMGSSGIVWFVALYLFVIWFLSPRNNTGSLVSAFAIALINLAIIAVFTTSLLFVVATTPAQPPPGSAAISQGFAATPIQIAIGAALYSFAGHISVSNSARLVLRRRGSGKGFLQGAVIGLATISVVYAIWAFASISALTIGVLPESGSILQSISLYFGPWASTISVVFIVLSLGIGSGNYAMAAHHVLVDTFKHHQKLCKGAAHSDRLGGGQISVLSREHILGVTVITLVMVAALSAYILGVVDLNRFFGLIGGMMAPIIAGVFPVLIFVACRQRGSFTESRVPDFLSGKIIVLFALMGFASVYVWQAATDDFAIWYRCLSIGLSISLLWLVCGLYRKGAFRTGGVILIEKGKDGWDPQTWQVFEGGCEVRDRTLMWKTALNGEFCTITSSTNPARVLSAVRLDRRQMKVQKFDVNVVDNTTRHPVNFTVNENDPAVLEIVIGK